MYNTKYKIINFLFKIIFNKFFSLIIIAAVIKMQIINEASRLHGKINLLFMFNSIPIKENIILTISIATKDLLKVL